MFFDKNTVLLLGWMSVVKSLGMAGHTCAHNVFWWCSGTLITGRPVIEASKSLIQCPTILITGWPRYPAKLARYRGLLDNRWPVIRVPLYLVIWLKMYLSLPSVVLEIGDNIYIVINYFSYIVIWQKGKTCNVCLLQKNTVIIKSIFG